DDSQSAAKRIGALWALSGLNQVDSTLLRPLFVDANRNVRREAVRASGDAGLPPGEMFYQSAISHDSDPEVRAEVIRVTGRFLANADPQNLTAVQSAIRILLNGFDLTPLEGPTGRSTHNGKVIKLGAAYEREFERYLVRLFLEQQPKLVADFLSFDSQGRPLENTVLGTLALDPKDSASRLAALLPRLERASGEEELLRLAQFPDAPGVADALKATLQNPSTRRATLESLLKVRSRLDTTKLTPLLDDAAMTLWSEDSAARDLSVRIASAFKLTSLEPKLVIVLKSSNVSVAEQTAALRALRELKSSQAELFAKLARSSIALRDDALAALVAARNERAPALTIELWSELNSSQRRSALAGLTGTKSGASAVVKSVKAGELEKRDLDAATLDKLHAVLGSDSELASLMSEMATLFRPALRLDGKDNAWVDSNITLDGGFTVETWVKLDARIDNNDGILGAPGALDMNFYAGQFRVWAGSGVHDVIVANRKMSPDIWTHVAVTRDAANKLRIYINGELDTAESKIVTNSFPNCRLGWTAPPLGTAGWLSEFRVWNRARTADEVRANFDRSFEDEAGVIGLAHHFAGMNWSKLQAGAKVAKTSDFPALLNPAEAKALAEKFSTFRKLAARDGDLTHGRSVFTTLCMSCHSVGGQGGQVGPVLNGAGATGVESLLRNLLTPNAAMEAGYRVFRVELKDGDVFDGVLVSQDKEAIILRRPNVDDTRIQQKDVRRGDFVPRSMMPDGLLEALPEKDVVDLLAFLKTLK
ncbi:MAG TPA: LamG-like jellyroll fold domain-containing protein, partial [Candidatus Acidoferrum sp.]|nr:LamG-like jellyroll fold domain-containing protein [Candidatus Acidoferrum sp.]